MLPGSERLNSYSFGARNPRLQVCCKVEMKLRNILGRREVVVEALEIDDISRASIWVPDRDICAEMEDRGLALLFDFKELSSDCQISLTPSPYLLAAILKFHFEQYRDLYSETCETLLKPFWVDDLVRGTEQVETALKITTEIVEILKKTRMVLRKWQTNSIRLREAWRRAGIENKTIEAGCGTNTKVLGLAWDPDKEIIYFDVASFGITKVELTERDKWSHCPGKKNPADILSRSIPASDLAKNSLWWHGPPWLSKPSEFWPSKIEIENLIGDLDTGGISNNS
ncbi:integrase catalytic domain-containing protein [Nephila pilipes]|uniref:Integrase catalytic domain-containing protein n=1 Tax=Nephila pilipes TaxID=299642 RepID=A0A8X6MZY4_NEPPI|nr:integrase catalytic domain-containing protein [Nephila pilipes]